MNGIEYKSILLLPIRSMRPSATSVNRKFVTATVKDVKVGLSNPTIVKMVAEKYINEFCQKSVMFKCSRRDTYKATKLLQTLKKTCNCQSASILAFIKQ